MNEDITITLKDGNVIPADATILSDPVIEANAKEWRNRMLEKTDWIVPVTDHPQHAAYLVYRQELRDWPSDQWFPYYNRPELGV